VEGRRVLELERRRMVGTFGGDWTRLALTSVCYLVVSHMLHVTPSTWQSLGFLYS
jgi:hypothetical protein